VDEALFQVITDMPVNSLITSPMEGFSHSAHGPLEIRGFAWSGPTPVQSVAVSTDGERWQTAELENEVERFAWRRFRMTLDPSQGAVTIMARATDAAGGAQPIVADWNPRGYCNNAVHRVRVAVAGDP